MKKALSLFTIFVLLLSSCTQKKSDIYRQWQLEDVLLSQDLPQLQIENFKKQLEKTKEHTILTYFEDSTYTLTTVDTVLKGTFVLDEENKLLKAKSEAGITQQYKITQLSPQKLVYQTNDPNTSAATFVFKAK